MNHMTMPMNVMENMAREISPVDRVRQTLKTCGTKAVVVRQAAVMPKRVR